MDPVIEHLSDEVLKLAERIAELEILVLKLSDATANAVDSIKRGQRISRQVVWFEAWRTLASSNNTLQKNDAIKWADDCLKEFDAKF